RGGAGHRDLRGRKIIVVIAEDEDLLVLAGAVRGDLDDGGARRDGGFGSGHWRGRLVRPGLIRATLAVRAVFVRAQVASQILGWLGDVVGERGHVEVLVGERGLKLRVLGQVRGVGVYVVETRVGVEIRLVEIHRSQAVGRAWV